MNWNKKAQEVHRNAVEHGWWETPRPIYEIINLCISELSEALEEARAGRPMAYVARMKDSIVWGENPYYYEEDMRQWRSDEKPEGIATEMADCIIRILDYMGTVGFSPEYFMAEAEKFYRPMEEAKNLILTIAHCELRLSQAFSCSIYDSGIEAICIRMAGCLNLILKWAEANDVDIERILELKHQYNTTREYKHGKKF
ncbi:MAG: hypothetical protein IJX67_10860 [Oscillospiraceae bacterium]|nr:hypothetical protein [Oscillospiraceae bacterium]